MHQVMSGRRLSSMKRPILRALVAIALISAISGASPAFARGQLAVGEVVPLEPPPGYAFRAVYTPPALGSRWEPDDTSYRRAFREPIYTAPRGYVYRHVRGYTRVRVAKLAARPVKVAIRKHTPGKKRSYSCITDLGYGHYYQCR
jgi:hypothetical protein